MDLTHEADAKAAATADATGRSSGTTQAQGSRARAIDIGKSMSQLRMRFTSTARESKAKVLDAKSLDSADEETKKAHQHSLQLERAAAKRMAEIAQAAQTKQMERKRPMETETSLPMKEDTEAPISMAEDDEVKTLPVENVQRGRETSLLGETRNRGETGG